MNRRTLFRMFALGCVASLALVAVAAPAGAGGPMETLLIVKEVQGEAPEGTVFVINLTCDRDAIWIDPNGDDEQELSSYDFEFGAEGGETFVIFSQNANCTLTEIDNGGAALVSYECFVENIGWTAECSAGSGGIDMYVEGFDPIDAIVTNTFTVPTDPDPVTPGPAAAAAAAPRFTG